MKTIKISEDLHSYLCQIKAIQKIKTIDQTIRFCCDVENPFDTHSEGFMKDYRNDKSKK